ncbi:cytochrome C biogenesis protein CcsA [Pseudomonas protegens]|uniref:cytochrome-c peroxidase n=1 Tax=Pseudomonas protegens TaxID=380021 RepID=UPI000C9A08EE|nr:MULTISPECIES: cytochrome-c peroxidase [Pseudomonas]MBS7561566.1 cytochrome-c peroxidase [Pseudomonas sp. RC4D1]PNG35487.1 cytochrome C biogenesis protein CcsA [Pseudomonas protegens]
MHGCKWLLVFGLLLGSEARGETPSEPILPVQPAKISDVAKVELGKQLFFDPRLSKSGFISCNSCHNLSMGGSDNLPTSIGHNWHQGPINSPTVLNSGLSFAQYWDGRAATLQEQASGPITNPGEMGFTHDLAVDVLRSIPQYRASFKRVYGNDEIRFEDATNAIAAFEDTLVTPNAPFDRWLKGDKAAISPTALKGYQLFKSIGCVACHNGEAVGGGSFQKMGMIEPYVTQNPAQGVAGLTGKDADRMLFKVPTLRNVALTYPYFHDGAYWKLEEAVDVMARLQLGRKLGDEEIQQIVAFLETLTGDQPDFKLPMLPPSSAQTPRPQPFN